MRAQVGKYWYAIRYSYWFVPSLMALAAMVLSFVTFLADVEIGERWPDFMLRFGLNTPEGARAVLSTIAGSMITVAGVSFSITIAAVVFATGQLGPRLLANFMGDRANQVTLGTFIATFVYNLLVLRTVHASGEGQGAAFVPHLGVLAAMLLALASLAVLIYFIHHVPRSIAASQVVASLGGDLNHRMSTLFPNALADPADGASLSDVAAALPEDDGWKILATSNGYITQVDVVGLVEAASKAEGSFWLRQRPGSFVSQGEVLATAHGMKPDTDINEKVVTAIVLDQERTNQQDILFVVQQLVEIAIRALSPGVNDPYTAISALDWLGSGAINLGRRAMPGRFRLDDDGGLRLIVPDLAYGDVAAAMFDRLRPYAAGDTNVALHMMTTLQRAAMAVSHPPYRAALLEQATALHDAAQASLPLDRDRLALQAAHARLFDELTP